MTSPQDRDFPAPIEACDVRAETLVDAARYSGAHVDPSTSRAGGLSPDALQSADVGTLIYEVARCEGEPSSSAAQSRREELADEFERRQLPRAAEAARSPESPGEATVSARLNEAYERRDEMGFGEESYTEALIMASTGQLRPGTATSMSTDGVIFDHPGLSEEELSLLNGTGPDGFSDSAVPLFASGEEVGPADGFDAEPFAVGDPFTGAPTSSTPGEPSEGFETTLSSQVEPGHSPGL